MKEENILDSKQKKSVFQTFKEIKRMLKMIAKNIHFIVKQTITKKDTCTQKSLKAKISLKVGSNLKWHKRKKNISQWRP